MLRKILADELDLERMSSRRQHGDHSQGALTIERLIGGDSTVPEVPGNVVRFPLSQGIPTAIAT